MDKKLILKKGGSLYLESSEYDNDIHTIKCEEIQTPINPFHLHDLLFEFEEGVTIEDLCVFLRKDIPYWELVIGNCVGEYVESCFVLPTKDAFDEGVTMEECVLTWGMGCTKFRKELSSNRPNVNFGMVGVNLQGQKINYGFGQLNLSNIKDLPIRIDNNLTVCYENLDDFFPHKKKEGFEDLFKTSLLKKLCPTISYWAWKLEYFLKNSQKYYGTMEMSMFNVLYGIFWELSFYGPPLEREEFFEKLGQDIEKIKTGDYEVKM